MHHNESTRLNLVQKMLAKQPADLVEAYSQTVGMFAVELANVVRDCWSYDDSYAGFGEASGSCVEPFGMPSHCESRNTIGRGRGRDEVQVDDLLRRSCLLSLLAAALADTPVLATDALRFRRCNCRDPHGLGRPKVHGGGQTSERASTARTEEEGGGANAKKEGLA